VRRECGFSWENLYGMRKKGQRKKRGRGRRGAEEALRTFSFFS
jgi:hypothetical protein